MKLYEPQKIEVVRVDIKGGKNNSYCITLEETNITETINFVNQSLKDVKYQESNSCLQPPSKVTISCYKAIGDRKGNSKSLTVYGLKSSQIKTILLNKIKNT